MLAQKIFKNNIFKIQSSFIFLTKNNNYNNNVKIAAAIALSKDSEMLMSFCQCSCCIKNSGEKNETCFPKSVALSISTCATISRATVFFAYYNCCRREGAPLLHQHVARTSPILKCSVRYIQLFKKQINTICKFKRFSGQNTGMKIINLSFATYYNW